MMVVYRQHDVRYKQIYIRYTADFQDGLASYNDIYVSSTQVKLSVVSFIDCLIFVFKVGFLSRHCNIMYMAF